MLRRFQFLRPAVNQTRWFSSTKFLLKGAPALSTKMIPFVASVNGNYCALFSPEHDEVRQFTDGKSAVEWIQVKSGGKIPAILPTDTPDTGIMWTSLKQTGVVANESAWSMAHGMLALHSRNIAGYRVPSSLEDAYHMLNNEVFAGSGAVATVVKQDGPERDACLAWATVHQLHQRFGIAGMKKQMPPLEQVLHRVVRVVNKFVVRLQNHVGVGNKLAGSKVKYTISVYDVQAGSTTSVEVENFTQAKVKSLIDQLFTPSTTSLFIITDDTSEAKMLNFLRLCGPKCPFFVCHSAVAQVSSTATDPIDLWKDMKDSLDGEEQVIRKLDSWANQMAASRTTRSKVKAQRKDDRQRLEVSPQAQQAEKTSVSSSSFIASRDTHNVDPEVMMKLEKWRDTIYSNPERKEREESAAKKFKRYLVLDLETTTVKRYKRIATPFTGENYIVLPGLLDYKQNITIPDTHLTREDPYKLPPLDDIDVIVGHNIKFDLLHLWKDPQLVAFFKRGGRVWDTMYAEFLLTGHRTKLGFGAGLEDVARKRGGKIPKLDAVKEAWANGVQTYDIPHATLKEYLIGDLKNTEMIFQQQLKEAVDQRQVVIIDARMDGLMCTTEMEFNGLKIDVKNAQMQKQKLADEITKAQTEMNTFVPSSIPLRYRSRFNWNSSKQLAALFFGGSFPIPTMARSSKALPGRKASRQQLCNNNDDTMLSPPANGTVAAYCAMISGQVHAEKATRLYKTYYGPLMSDMSLRSSAELSEVAETISVVDGKTMSLAAALSKTIVPLMCGVELDASGAPTKLFLQNAAFPKETASHTVGAATTDLVAFLKSQIKKHTKPVLAADGSAMQLAPPAIALLCRDAAFIMNKALLSTPGLQNVFENRSTELEWKTTPDFCIQIVDSTAVNELAVKMNPRYEVMVATKEYTMEADLGAEAWCETALTRLKVAADITFNAEAQEKKMTKRQREKAEMQLKTGDAITVEVLDTHVNNIQDRLSLTDGELASFKILRLLGKSTATVYDGFCVGTNEPEEIAVVLPGFINHMNLSDADKTQAMEKFRSAVTRAPAVNDEALKFFAKNESKVAGQLRKLRKMTKLMGTYFEDTGTGMVSLVHSNDDCIHHELIHNNTNTGRLASANPNCQNIPKEDKSDLREMFVSRFDGGRCIECDYSQLEVITLCALAHDTQMLIDLKNKVDFHCKRVTMMRPDLSYQEVLQRAKKDKEPEFVKLRQQAKIFSFQRQYGAGVATISESTKLDPETVKKLIEGEKATYKDIDMFTRVVTLSAQVFNQSLQDGSRNAQGDIKFKGMFPVITGSRYVFSEQDIPASMMKVGAKSTAFSPTHIKNYPVQGFAGEIVQIMLGRLWRSFVYNNNYDDAALLTNTVHDCVWVDCKPDVTKAVGDDVAAIMSSAQTVLNELWPEMQCPVEFPVDVVVGKNMCHLEPF